MTIPPDYVSIRTAYAKLAELDAYDAVGRLTFFLREGKLPASHFDHDGVENKLHANFWKNITNDARDIFFNVEGKEIKSRRGWEIVVRKEDLSAILAPEKNAASVDTINVNSTKKGGRPPEYDWDAIWAGIVWIAVHEGLPKSQAEMIERVQQWYKSSSIKTMRPAGRLSSQKSRSFTRA